jgi:spore maturation protein CgeB
MSLSGAGERTTGMSRRSYTILAPGFAKWWGSDARALGQALRRLGHTVLDVDEEDYLPWRPQGIGPKLLRRLFGRVYAKDYNQAVSKHASDSAFDFVLSFKGNSLTPDTLANLRSVGKPIYNFYPDVSFADHGPNIPHSLKLYDCVFTTKSYHGEREIKRYGIRDLEHVRHGFDPEVHRPIALSPQLLQHYGCDVSFVGCWAPEKEARLLFLLKAQPELVVKVYGMGWNYSSADFRKRLGRNLKRGVFGDELSLVYCASKINLGLLSYSTSDATAKDQTTARSFQIPATGSLMLHEDTPEIRHYFADGREVLLFSDNDQMVDQINHALQSPMMRTEIQREGYERCQREPYDYSSAANRIIEYFENARRGRDSINKRVVISEQAILETV